MGAIMSGKHPGDASENPRPRTGRPALTPTPWAAAADFEGFLGPSLRVQGPAS